jgi:hypothetical protein
MLSRSRALVALFAALVLFPASAFFAVAAPSWSLLYAMDPDKLPQGATIFVGMIAAAIACAGHELGVERIRSPAAERLAIAVGPIALGLLAMVVLRARVLAIASYGDFVDKRGVDGFFSVRFFATAMALDIFVAVAAVLTFRALASMYTRSTSS